MAHAHETLESLAAKVAQLTWSITSYLNSEGLPQPSFAVDGPAAYPATPELTASRMMLIQSLTDMLHLARGGRDFIFTQSIGLQHDIAVLDVLNQFDFWSAVPLTGSTTYDEISQRTKLPVELVHRFLRHAATMRLFTEEIPAEGPDSDDNSPSPRRVVHTSTSAFVARNPAHRSWMSHHLEESHHACTRLPDALRKFSLGKDIPSQELNETPFALAFGDCVESGKFWDFIRRDGEGSEKGFRLRRFAQAMRVARISSAMDFQGLLTTGFNWESLGEGTVVDVGGSSGQDAIVLAQTYPKLKLVVQDLPPVEEAFNANVPPELRSRITFQAHDFLTPQPVAANVYFFKAILHDWPDKYASKILGALVPSLRSGSRIIMCEGIFPPPGSKQWRSLPLPVQRFLSVMDLQMFVLFNAKQRTVEDWKKVLREADCRFELEKVYRLYGSPFGILEIVFRD